MIQTEKLDYFTYRTQGKKFFFRPLLAQDRQFLKEGFRKLSPKSRYQRFFSYQKELTDSQLDFFSTPDGKDHVAWGVMDVTGFEMNPVGTARFIRNKDDRSMAEVAITIVDTYQRMGLGRILMAILNMIGSRQGISHFQYNVLQDNEGMMKGLTPMNMRKVTVDRNIVVLEAEVVGSYLDLPDDERKHKFREVMRMVEEKLFGQNEL